MGRRRRIVAVNAGDLIGLDDDRNRFKRFAPPCEPELAELLGDVMMGRLPSWWTSVRFKDLKVHVPPQAERNRLLLVEEPTLFGLRASIEDNLRRGEVSFDVYRAEDGSLVMFDDYVNYVVAEAIGLEIANVHILGEAKPPTIRL